MSSFLKRGTCAAIIAVMTATTAVPAMAQYRGGDRDRYIERYYGNNAHDRDYRRWRENRRHWSDRDYRRWYERRHRHRRDNNNNAAAAIFGLAAGAIAGAAVSSANRAPSGVPSAGGYPAFSDGYMRYCSNKYRSFDPRSGTFLGYDGNRHYCQ